MSVSAWEAVFMLLVLKIPMVYLGAVVWWAVRAAPSPGGGGEEIGTLVPLVPCGWDAWKRGRPARAGRRPLRPTPPQLRARARAAS